MHARPQKTLKREVSFSGVGIHTGKEVLLRFCPAPPNSGIFFQRIDLPERPIIPASIKNVVDTSRSTTIAAHGACVQTVEHVLAAVYAYEIDNLCIQVTEAETPVGDGSSLTFVNMIETAGLEEQLAERIVSSLSQPVFVSHGSTYLVALPAEEYRISYTLHYPNTPLIKSQYLSLPITTNIFKQELAPCRTFALYEEIAVLIEKGLIRGGSLENAVVIKDDVVLSEGGLRFSDEMVRHKMLDLVGDLALVEVPFLAHVIAIRSGHMTNVALGKEMMKCLTSLSFVHGGVDERVSK